MTVYVLDAHAHFETLILVVKMSAVLEDILPKSIVLLCAFFCGQMNSMQKICIKKYLQWEVFVTQGVSKLCRDIFR
jgi:hypothetical protein